MEHKKFSDIAQTMLLQAEARKHAMQTGVKLTYARSPMLNQMNPALLRELKHLRVGINAALVEVGALAQLLVDKDIITDVEYARAMLDGIEQEVQDYEKKLGVKLF